MSEFIKFKCPNRYRGGTTTECGHFLGGVSRETLSAHSKENPYKDLRYCRDCHCFYLITIAGTGSLPEFKMLPIDKKIKWVDLSEEYPLIKISGDRPIKVTND